MIASGEVEIFGHGHRLHLLPNFTKEVLKDSEDVENAFERVVQARKVVLTKTQKMAILDKIKYWMDTAAGPNSEGQYVVGQLRKIDLDRWKYLRIPLMAREYLRNLILQAQDLNEKQILECQFNRGRQIEWEKHYTVAEMLTGMGFDRKEATEALVMKNFRENEAVDLLLAMSAQDRREWEYQKKVEMKKRKMHVSFDQHWSVLKIARERGIQKKKLLKQSMSALRRKIHETKQGIKDLKTTRKQLEEKLQMLNYKTELDNFSAFLKGLIDSGEINSSEMQKVSNMKQKFKDHEVVEIIKSHGKTMEEFDNLKQFEDTPAENLEDECVFCFGDNRDFMYYPCGHVALCEACSQTVDSKTCIVCRRKATKMIQVIK